VFDHPDFDRHILFTVAELDFKRLVNSLFAGVHVEIRLLSFAHGP